MEKPLIWILIYCKMGYGSFVSLSLSLSLSLSPCSILLVLNQHCKINACTMQTMCCGWNSSDNWLQSQLQSFPPSCICNSSLPGINTNQCKNATNRAGISQSIWAEVMINTTACWCQFMCAHKVSTIFNVHTHADMWRSWNNCIHESPSCDWWACWSFCFHSGIQCHV